MNQPPPLPHPVPLSVLPLTLTYDPHPGTCFPIISIPLFIFAFTRWTYIHTTAPALTSRPNFVRLLNRIRSVRRVYVMCVRRVCASCVRCARGCSTGSRTSVGWLCVVWVGLLRIRSVGLLKGGIR